MAAPASYSRRSFVGNAAATTVPLGLGAADGSCTIASATNWPSGSGGDFLVVIDRGQNTEELAWSSGVSGTTLTFALRGAQGTSGVAHAAGCTIALSMGSQDLDEANQVVSGVLGQSGAAKGDILTMLSAAGPNTLTRVGIGGTGALLQVVSGLPAWLSVGAAGTLLQGGTNPSYGVVSGALPLTPAKITTTQAMVAGTAYAATSGTFTATLPAPAVGVTCQITNYGSGIVTVAQHSAEVIYGLGMTSAGVASFTLGTYGATATLLSLDGTSWWVVAGQQDSGWLTTGLANSWANALGTWGYRLVGNRVYLRGDLHSGANNSSPFTLPSGFRPPQLVLGSSAAYDNSTIPQPSMMTIATNGVATAYYVAGAGLANYSIDTIQFTVD